MGKRSEKEFIQDSLSPLLVNIFADSAAKLKPWKISTDRLRRDDTDHGANPVWRIWLKEADPGVKLSKELILPNADEKSLMLMEANVCVAGSPTPYS
ncbi:hypothetical protein LCGC14_2066850, partial [marine sediment metagenome]